MRNPFAALRNKARELITPARPAGPIFDSYGRRIRGASRVELDALRIFHSTFWPESGRIYQDERGQKWRARARLAILWTPIEEETP